MADGDVFENGRLWLKTTARKMFKGDQTFDQSAAWSARKIVRDGGLTAFKETVDLLQRVIELQRDGIDHRIVSETCLNELARIHLDQDSGAALRLVRGMLIDGAFVSTASYLRSDDLRLFIGQQLLARFIVETLSTPDLIAALPDDSTRDRRSPDQITKYQEWGTRYLCRSTDIRELVIKWLGACPDAFEQELQSRGPVPVKSQRLRFDYKKDMGNPAVFGD